jgi:site-specific DNA recombinase
MALRTALYCRISQDEDQDRLGVQRQEHDLRREADRAGDELVAVLVDNDLSGSGNVRRPDFDRLIEMIQQGELDRVRAVDLDRLIRGWRPFVELYEACQRARIKVTWLGGEADFSTGNGLLELELRASFAREEWRKIRSRTRRKMQELAEAGRFHTGGRRAYGYRRDGQVEPAEAAILREARDRVLAGESVRSVVRDLNGREVSTVTGRPWSVTVLRGSLIRPRLAGYREFHGELIKGDWPPIFSEDDWKRLHAVLTDPKRRTNERGRRHLLAGILVCGKCGRRLKSRPRSDGGAPQPGYICPGRELGGCNGIRIKAEPLEQFTQAAILQAMDNPDLLSAIARRPENGEVADTMAEVNSLRTKLDEYAAAFGRDEFSYSEWQSLRRTVDSRLQSVRARLERLERANSLAVLFDASELRCSWESLSFDRRRTVIRALVDHIIVMPSTTGRQFDPNRLDFAWKI